MKHNFYFRKILTRSKIIFSGAIFRLSAILGNVLISLFIIRTASENVWGEMVAIILFIDLGFAIINFGNSNFLNRRFSEHPSKLSRILILSFFSRSILAGSFVALIWATPFPQQIKSSLMVWSVARFVYQTFEPVTMFERNFNFAILLELVAISCVILPMTIDRSLIQSHHIVSLFAVAFSIRAAGGAIFYRRLLHFTDLNINFVEVGNFFRSAFPFFLLTSTAMLQQRIDLYMVAFFLIPSETAQYQVFLNFLLVGQMGASLILSPFSKNIFRMSRDAIRALEKQYISIGFVLSLVTTGMIWLIVTIFYRIELSFSMYLMGYGYILMFYIYLIKNYELGKDYRQTKVALISVAGFSVNVILSMILIPRFRLEGAMLAGLLSQIFITIVYHKGYLKNTLHAAGKHHNVHL